MSKQFRIQDIGNTLKLRPEIDPGFKVTNWFKQGLNVVDLFPAHFKLDLSGGSSSSNNKSVEFIVYNHGSDVSLGFYDPSERFRNRCIAYGFDKDIAPTALRLWITSESTFQEEFGTEYETNLIQSGINGLVSKLHPLLAGIKSNLAATGSKGLTQVVNQAVHSVTGFVSDHLKFKAGSNTPLTAAQTAANAGVDSISSIANLLANNATQFGYISMPKTYSGSSYNPSLNFNVRLISPYGHPKAIQKFILEPLIYLLLLNSPTTRDGVTYGGASYVTVKAYGISNMDLATIDNISIRRGGNDVSYNKYRQPLSVDVNISIKPAADGFAAFINQEINNESGMKMNTREITSPNGVKGMAYSNLNTNGQDSGTDWSKNSLNLDNNNPGTHSTMTTVGSIIESFKPQPVANTFAPVQSNTVTASPPAYDRGSVNIKPNQKSTTSNTNKIMSKAMVV